MPKKIILSLLLMAALAAVYGLWKYRPSSPKSPAEEILLKDKAPELARAPMECATESEQVQLMDSEKCEWKCSDFLTAPTSERCIACKGIVIPQNCPMCPPLCRPSFWIYEKDKR